MNYIYTGKLSSEVFKELILKPPVEVEYKFLENMAEIKFESYSPEAEPEAWEKGRLFGAKGEIKWRKADGYYYVIYLGEEPLEDFMEEENIELETGEERSYFLWGERTEGKTDEWIELRIPNLLNYPVKGEKSRVKLVVMEYINKKVKSKFYRYKCLEEVNV